MNPTYHWARAVTLGPSANSPDLYSMLVSYSAEYDKQFYKAVHVPPDLAAVFAQEPCGFHLETLDCGGHASRLLKGGPQFAVLAVTDQHGNHYTHYPAPWTHFCRRKSLLALCALTGAIIALAVHSNGSVLVAAALSHIAAKALRDRRSVSSARPFKIEFEMGRTGS